MGVQDGLLPIGRLLGMPHDMRAMVIDFQHVPDEKEIDVMIDERMRDAIVMVIVLELITAGHPHAVVGIRDLERLGRKRVGLRHIEALEAVPGDSGRRIPASADR